MLRRIFLLFLLSAVWNITDVSAGSPDPYGVLIMAHGADGKWNQAVLNTVEPLTSNYQIEIAFGMADPATIREAVDKLEERGVKKIGVIRLFVSGESFYKETEQVL